MSDTFDCLTLQTEVNANIQKYEIWVNVLIEVKNFHKRR